jgi:hypothetical protein
MFSKPLAFVLLALACLTAAAGGAYFAARHNESDAAVAAQAAPAKTPDTVQAGIPVTPAPQPVAETEAAVSAKTPEVKPLAEAAPAEAPAPAPSQPVRRDPKPAVKAAPATPAAPVARTETPASRPPQRPVAANGGTAPATQTEPASAPQPAPPAQAAPAQVKPQVEPVKPVEEPQPEPARVPQFEEVILPASAVIGLQVETATSTEKARVEDRVDARVSRDVMAAGRVAIPAGSRMIGSVTTVERGGKMKEQARLGIRFHTLVLSDGTQVPLQTEPVMRLGDAPASSSTKKIGGAAVGGAILGAILGGGKGAAAGGAIGAGAGTAAVMAGDRSAATLRQGEYLNVKLSSPATITVPRVED